MATIKKYALKSGETRYMVRYRKPDGKTTDKGGFRTKKEAQAWANTAEVAKLRGEFVTVEAGRVTIDELWPRWLATKSKLAASYVRTLEVAYPTHVKPTWGDVPVSKVKRSEVSEWVHKIDASPSVSRRAHGILAGILDLAVDDKAVYANLARGISLPKKEKQKHKYLTLPQVSALAQQAKEHGNLVWFLALTGLRWGEAIALEGRHLDREEGCVSVEESITMVGSTPTRGTTKGREHRNVPVPSAAMERIPKVMPRAPLWPVPKTGKPRTYPPGKESWLEFAVNRCRAADEAFPLVTVHDLRHTAASIAVSSGANVKAVQRMLGHKSAAMTLDVYADLFDDDLKVVAAAIDAKVRAECG